MTAVDTPARARSTSIDPVRPAGPRPERRPGRHLKPVERPSRPVAGGRTRPAAPVLVGTGMVIAALFALAAMHALLIGGQIRLDDSQRAVASETEEIRALRLRVAELESPGRVLDVARERLGMVEPGEVGYLLPGTVDTGSDERIRVAAAEPPPPPPEPELLDGDDASSPEQDAVDQATDVDDTSNTGNTGNAGTGNADDPVDQETGTAQPDPSPTETDAAPDAPVAEGGNE